jgi:hypothetical protein
MSATIRPVEYFTTTLHDSPEAASQLLSTLASSDVNLLAFNAIPVGLRATQLVLFPEDPQRFARLIKGPGWTVAGPQRAFLVQGDDELGALARLHQRLADAGVHPFASAGVTDGRGGFGYLIYVSEAEFDQAAAALEVGDFALV